MVPKAAVAIFFETLMRHCQVTQLPSVEIAGLGLFYMGGAS